ncbi:MAG: hypothetical protein JWR75_21 [Devosia sp.]|nr:hypothetical protein [Devosia sp.]
MLSDAFIDEVFADIERLTSRDYAEIGVPMFLIAEDLSPGAAASVPPVSPHRSALLGAAFDQVWAAIVARKPELDAVDISRAIEVVADRYILALAASEFSRLTDEPTYV